MKLQVSIHAINLKNVAGAFKGTSDPFCVVTLLATTPGAKPKVLGKTEIVKNTLSPNWVHVFTVDYELGTPVKLACNVFDQVKKGDNKTMGSAIFDVGECLGARGSTKAKKLKNGGTLFCAVRKAVGSGTLRLGLTGKKLKNVENNLFGKSDPFFELSRQVNAAGSQTWDNVYRSNHVKNNLNPVWETAILDLSVLCGGDLDLPIQIAVYDHESSGKHIAMGTSETTVRNLQGATDLLSLRKKGKEMGAIQVTKAEVSGIASEPAVAAVTTQMAATTVSSTTAAPFVPPSSRTAGLMRGGGANFVDYIAGGCDLNVCVAIDYTGSNGDPRKPGTLHHLGAGRTDYEKAIAAIVGILAKYDTDQQFPVYGFGAKYGGVVRHLFQCGATEEVHGVQGVLAAYRQVFSSGLVMSGPTVFTEVIDTAAAKAMSEFEAAQQRGSQAYTILLILTDGAVSDVNATAAALDRASKAPLSVVIVGLGNADFGAMKFLDDAGNQRDIAQFVEFNKHSNNSVALTKETLQEIPEQLVSYFQSKGIAPQPALQRSDSTVSVMEAEEEEIDLTLDITEDEIVVTGGGDGFVDGFGR